MALYIFSDAHLGCGNPDQEAKKIKRISELFELVRIDGDRLVILGDLFDFWFEYKKAIPKEHHEVLFMLGELVKSSIKVDYVSGNHDFWVDDFFENQLKLSVHRDSLETTYAGLKLFLIHGDGLAPADRGYRFLKKILRNRFNIWLYRKLPPDWAIPLAKYVSRSSRDYTSQRDHTFASDYQTYALTKLKDSYDLVVIGHLHIPVMKKFDEGVYINSGDFINHFSYVRLDESGAKLEFLK